MTNTAGSPIPINSVPDVGSYMMNFRKQLISISDLRSMLHTIVGKCNNVIQTTHFPFKKQALSTRKVFTDLLKYMDHKSKTEKPKLTIDAGDATHSFENVSKLELNLNKDISFNKEQTMSPKGALFDSTLHNTLNSVQSEAKFILPSIRA